jgi:hypothetical protein
LKVFIPFLIIAFFPQFLAAQSLDYTLSNDSLVNRHASDRRVYTTVRTDNKPKIDGILDDICWQQDGVWAGDFVQQQPNQGQKPSQPTEVKILYDDDYLYIALKCHDDEPGGIRNLLGRRDDFTVGDIAGVALDTYHDKQTAFEFNVTAAGQKVDLMHLGAFMWDTNWNAVWDGKAHIGDSIWTSEMRVPFSQLRFSDEKEQVWGMHIWRWISRLGEEDQWKLIPIDAPAMVYIFGELHGIKDIPKKHHFEMMPYGALRHISNNQGNKLLGFGIDGKAALSSNFMLDYTLFPDFGQVEADPSVLNLTAYEVFYDERRPFFLEGNAILEYGIGSDMLFYSRRIGHAPAIVPTLSANQSMSAPSQTDIINALKVTGKTKNGFSLGIVNSLTQQEYAEISEGDNKSKYAIEPLTNYFVARAKQDYNNRNTVIGGMVTSAIRRLNTSQFEDNLPAQSFAGGLDLLHQWKNRKYFVDAKTFFSDIKGSESAITQMQLSPIHLYQRTDAKHLEVDSTATKISGWGGEVRGGKQSGKFRASGNLSWRSPGLDLNDVGYLREADIITEKVKMEYYVNEPKKILRSYRISVQQQHDWSFGGENNFDLLEVPGEFKFNNLWQLNTELAHSFNKLDTRQLRGGPSLRIDPHSLAGFMLSTNSTKKLSVGVGLDRLWAHNGTSESTRYKFHFMANVSNRFTITSDTYYENLTDNNQYVSSPEIYSAGRIDREILYTVLRVEYFINPELSLQLYGSPYTSNGKFNSIYKVEDSQAKDPNDRYAELIYLSSDDEYQYYFEKENTQAVWPIENPDFSFQEFRSNFVLRWEYKAGSTFFFVWSHNRSRYSNTYEKDIVKSFSNLGDSEGNNAITVKFSYWFSL